MIATDGDEVLLEEIAAKNLRENMKRLGLESRGDSVKVKPFRWGNVRHAADLSPPFDVVLVADCSAAIYEDAYADLVNSIVVLCHDETVVLLSYEERVPSIEAKFFHMLRAKFEMHPVPRERLHDDFQGMEKLNVLELKLKRQTQSQSKAVIDGT